MLKSTQYNIESLTVFLHERTLTPFLHWSFPDLAISPCKGVFMTRVLHSLQKHLRVEALKVNMVLNMKVFRLSTRTMLVWKWTIAVGVMHISCQMGNRCYR